MKPNEIKKEGHVDISSFFRPSAPSKADQSRASSNKAQTHNARKDGQSELVSPSTSDSIATPTLNLDSVPSVTPSATTVSPSLSSPPPRVEAAGAPSSAIAVSVRPLASTTSASPGTGSTSHVRVKRGRDNSKGKSRLQLGERGPGATDIRASASTPTSPTASLGTPDSMTTQAKRRRLSLTGELSEDIHQSSSATEGDDNSTSLFNNDDRGSQADVGGPITRPAEEVAHKTVQSPCQHCEDGPVKVRRLADDAPSTSEVSRSLNRRSEGGEEDSISDDQMGEAHDSDGIEEDDSDNESKDNRKKVAASSDIGQRLLNAARVQQHSPPSSRGNGSMSTGAGSLFAQAGVTPCSNEMGLNDMTSARFDPSSLETKALQPKDGGQAKAGMGPKCLLFEVMSRAFDKIESVKGSGTGSKKQCAVILANLFRIFMYHSRHELVPAVYICLNKVAPDFEAVETGVGESLIIKALSETYGRTEAAIKQDLIKYEDLGEIAAVSRTNVRMIVEPRRLTVSHVFEELKALASVTGQNAMLKKRDKIKKLLVGAKFAESKYIVRFLQSKLRIGVQNATIYQALAFAFVLSKPERSSDGFVTSVTSDVRRVRKFSFQDLDSQLSAMEAAVRAAHCEVPNIEVIIGHIMAGVDAETLPLKCFVTPGIPVQPMLAKPTKGVLEVFERFSNCTFTCEYKYDGERAQIHLKPNGEICVFSRNLENLTDKYPDVAINAKLAFTPGMVDCILDCEAVAYDVNEDRILPFQILSTRKRKDVTVADVTVQVCIFAFDCIRFNGECLLRRSLKERREYLHRALVEVPMKIQFAKHTECSSMEEMDAYLQESIDGATEGLIVKTLESNASYEPSKRSLNWLKVKKDYVEGMTDSLDLVPIGAFYGHGKRTGVYGAFLLACYDVDTECFQTCCKTATGFSAADLKSHFESLVEIAKKPSHYIVHERMEPDVWFETTQVWECKVADLQISPIHTSAMGQRAEDKGIGMRFPRFLRVRDDKKCEMATTSIQIAEMYDGQFTGAGAQGAKKEIQEEVNGEEFL